MPTFKKVLFAFCVFFLVIYVLMGFLPTWQVGLLRLGVSGIGIQLLRKFLRKEVDWVSTTIGSLGIVFCAMMLAAGFDFLIASKAAG